MRAKRTEKSGTSVPFQEQADILESARRMIRNGDMESLIELLRKNPGLAEWRDAPEISDRQPTLLHELATQNDPEHSRTVNRMAETLLEAGAEKDARDQTDSHGETPLQLSAKMNNAALCRALLDAGADPELTGRYDGSVDTALGYALFFETDERRPSLPVNCSDILVNHGARIYLPFAAALGQYDRVRQFFRNDRALLPNAGIAEPEKTLIQAFLFACKYGRIQICEYLLNTGVDINASMPFFDHHCTGLHLACEQGQQIETAAFLIENGADPAICDKRFDATPAGWAMFNGQDKVFRMFLERGMENRI